MQNRNKYYLEGESIYLREVRQEDVNESYYRWLNDPEVNQFLETRYSPRSTENIAAFVKSMDSNFDELFLAICVKEKNRHIGNIKLGPINWIHRFADISLVIGDKEYWRKGIGTEAIGLITMYAFNSINLNKVRAGCYEENIGSIKAFENNSFQREGLLKKQWYSKGRYTNEILLGLLQYQLKEK
jgi:RimJ/RimL family protein N-acetyltransferase